MVKRREVKIDTHSGCLLRGCFSLEMLGHQEETEWRDTVHLHKNEVRTERRFYRFMPRRIFCWVFKLYFTVFQKTLLRYYLFEGLRYVWLDRKGSFCRVRYPTKNGQLLEVTHCNVLHKSFILNYIKWCSLKGFAPVVFCIYWIQFWNAGPHST